LPDGLRALLAPAAIPPALVLPDVSAPDAVPLMPVVAPLEVPGAVPLDVVPPAVPPVCAKAAALVIASMAARASVVSLIAVSCLGMGDKGAMKAFVPKLAQSWAQAAE